MSYTIIEVANTHGGDEAYMLQLIETFGPYTGNFGIKFQPLHPDQIATPDFSAYAIYQKLHFDNEQWRRFIRAAAATKDVWIDLFDSYGVDILTENIGHVHGIKLQVSALFNHELIGRLAKTDLSGLKLIINVAALEPEEIRSHLSHIGSQLAPAEIILEIGFQAYPTEISDSGLSKIATIKKLFGNRIVFADHIDGQDEAAIWLPCLALSCGADYIEKHVMLGDRKTEYDHFSSLTPDRFARMTEKTAMISRALSEPFINQREKNYLAKTMFKPVAKQAKSKGQGLSCSDDLSFRRSDRDGLNITEIRKLLSDFHILSGDVAEGRTFERHHFKKATIGVIVAARLKSTRLKEKALLKIGELTSVEKCLKNACSFTNVNHVILATSTLESDAALANHTYSDQVLFHRGHPDDVIDRYLGIARQLKIDVIIRATGDNPFIDNALLQVLLGSHFATGADYTTARKAAIGTNLEIINTSALETVKKHFPSAEYSEYMTWYFANNPHVFRLNYADLPEHLVRDYRLTLDYDEDLEMFRKIDEELSKTKAGYTLTDVFAFLDPRKDVSELNAHIQAKYHADEALIRLLNEKTRINPDT